MIFELILRLISNIFSVKSMFLLLGMMLGSFLMKHAINYRDFYMFIDSWFFASINWLLGI